MFLNEIAHTPKWKTAKHVIDFLFFFLKHRRVKDIFKLTAEFVNRSTLLGHFLELQLQRVEAELATSEMVSWLLAAMGRLCDVIKEMNFRGSPACFISMEPLGI